jgi:hypothetical protein
VPVTGQLSEWTKLAGRDTNLKLTLERLYELFKDAPDLGSLIDPNNIPAADRMFLKDYSEVAHLVEAATADTADDPAAAVFGATAQGVARAGDLLARRYTLVATNPPFLGSKKMAAALRERIEVDFRRGKGNTAVAFLVRCHWFCASGGTEAMVVPRSWLFQKTHTAVRRWLLSDARLAIVVQLGPGAFVTIGGEVVDVTLSIIEARTLAATETCAGADLDRWRSPTLKAAALRQHPLTLISQGNQLAHPDSRIVVSNPQHQGALLETVAVAYQGLVTGDMERFVRKVWEVALMSQAWERIEGAADDQGRGGRTDAILWDGGNGRLHHYARLTREKLHDMHESGNLAWGKFGVAVNRMKNLRATPYYGDLFHNNVSVVLPKAQRELCAVLGFCSSEEFGKSVRAIDGSLSLTNQSLMKVPFDLEYWQKEAERLYPDGLPEPHSDDPTQWLFKGNIVGSEAGLQVAVARLLGYKWPDQGLKTGDSGLSCEQLDGIVDEDGIVCMPAVNGEQPAAERLRGFLAAAFANPPYGKRPRGAPPWPTLPPTVNAWVDALLAQAGSAGKGLDEWLRDDFFAQHIKLFHNRPFIWQIWDGEKDGFSALVNYHRLDYAGLQKLIYVYLNWWIDVQRAGVASDVPGAGRRLGAAQALQKKLELILDGEEPYDIYVRWKAVHEQAIGWNPDLDDGVRMNIRPFMLTCHPKKPGHPEPPGILRRLPNINWKKDRGRNADGSERLNDLHLSLQLKREARANVGGGA